MASDVPERWANIAEDAAYFENEPLRAARIGAQAVLADLRRQVTALPHTSCQSMQEYVYGPGDRRWESTGRPCDCPIADVLDLLDTGGAASE